MLRHMIFVVSVAWAAFSCIGWTFVFPSNMLSDDLHFVPLSLSPMIKKTPGEAFMLSSDSLSPQTVNWCRVLCTTQLARHDQPPKWSKIQILSCLEWQAGWKWPVASNFTILFFFTFTFDNFKRVRSVVFFFTIISHVCAIKQLEMRSNLIVPVLQFINIIPWPSIPVLPMEDWISGWLWDYLNHCITVFCSVFFYLKWPHLLLFDGVNITRTLKPKKKWSGLDKI